MFAAARNDLVSRTPAQSSPDDVLLLAFVHTPWLDDVTATRAFFDDMDTVREAADLDDLLAEGDVDEATRLLDAYTAAAAVHGANGYREAIDAVRAGAPPESAVVADVVTIGPTVPPAISLRVGSNELVLEGLASKKGNLWYSVTSGRGGIAVDEEPGGLPDVIQLDGHALRLGPVPLYDPSARAYVQGEHEPFDVKRGLEVPVTIGGYEFEMKVRVTVKKRGGWHVTASAVPQEKVPASMVGAAAPAVTHASEERSTYGTQGDTARAGELLDAIRQWS